MNRITYHILPLIERTLHAAPVDWREVFAHAGLPSPALTKGAPPYIDMDDLLEALAHAAELADDDHIVLRHFDISAWNFYPTLYASLVSLSSDMRDFVNSYRRYSSLHTSGYHRLQFFERKGYFEVEFEMQTSHPGAAQFVDLQLMILESGTERLSGSGLPALKLDLARKSCEKTLYQSRFPGIEIHCGMPQLRVYCDLEVLDRRFRSANTRLPRVLQERVERDIRELRQESDFQRALRSLLVTSLEHGAFNSEFAATKLGMSHRGFFRKLEAEGLTFQQVLDDFRHENALRFLLESDRDLEDIALILGFSGERAFRRFFQKVEGTTPVKYRKQYK